ncbi:hypothetical protein H312_00434 [Anncaliia algerae PRA339]|uniref:Uncharacterized protein n=1 Tax=Anncaliia algerae PRA339 TaxID=1288291 RepID=A0A059F4Y8_9MICR|nr:hypothetical protein H312_00434 [Anncaliia algerae PRA339]
MQSFSKNPVIAICACIIAIGVVITIGILKATFFPSSAKTSTPASTETTEKTATPEVAKQPKGKKTEKSDNYLPIYYTCKLLEADKNDFDNLKFDGKEEIKELLNKVEDYHKDLSSFKKSAKKLLDKLELNIKKLGKEPGLFLFKLFKDIIKEEIADKVKLEEHLKSDFVKKFCIICEDDENFYFDPFIEDLNQAIIAPKDDSVDVTILEDKNGSSKKILHMPERIIVLFEKIFESENIDDPKKYFFDIKYLKTAAKLLKIVEGSSETNNPKLIYEFYSSVGTDSASEDMSIIMKSGKALKYFIREKEEKLPADDTKIYPIFLICKKETPQKQGWFSWVPYIGRR